MNFIQHVTGITFIKFRHPDLLAPRLASTSARLLLLALSATMLGACSSDSDSDPVVEQETPAEDAGSETEADNEGDEDADGSSDIATLILDASAGGFGAEEGDAANKWAYLDLDSGEILDLSDEEASLSTQWDVALKRVDVRTNGGASGPGNVTAALADAQSIFYDEDGEADLTVFKAATADSELPALQRSIDTTLLTFEADSDVAAINGSGIDEAASWWLYNSADHTLYPNADVWYLIRSADGQSSVPAWFEDAPGGVFMNSSWYAYNLEGNHRIWPNYRVYAVDTGEAIYKMQLLSYYDEAGTSGIITLRYGIVE